MTIFAATARTVLFVMSFGLLAACSQTATSTHGSNVSSASLSNQDLRQKKIIAARKRAKAIKAAKQKSFAKARLDRQDVRKNSVTKRKPVKSTKRTKLRKKSRLVAKKSTKKLHARKTTYKKKLPKKSRAYLARAGRKAGRLKTNAPWRCVPARLKRVIKQVRKRYGAVTINSTYRSRRKNRRIGGKRHSYHLHCNAVDFRVHGRTRGLTRFLARNPSVGGWKRYPSGYYHIDTGPKRTW